MDTFFEREEALARFKEVLADQRGQVVIIVGAEGSGKRSLLNSMVMYAEKSRNFHCDCNIHKGREVKETYTLLKSIGKWPSGIVADCRAQPFLKRLSKSVDEFGDVHRRVVGIEAEAILPQNSGSLWHGIVKNVGDKIKFIFTQRPDDVLTKNETFMKLPNVVRIDLKPQKSQGDSINQTIEIKQAVETGQGSNDGEGDNGQDAATGIPKERILCLDFIDYLIKNKGYRRSNMIYGNPDRGKDINSRLKLEIVDHENKQLALVIFSLNDNKSNTEKAWNYFVHVNSQLAGAGFDGYLVSPGGQGQKKGFSIIKFSDHANRYESILIEDFPVYKEPDPETPDNKLTLFYFRAGLDIDGSKILNRIIDLAGDSNIGLYAEDVDESYANLKLTDLKKTDDVAVQIHKYGEYENQIALAVVGPGKGIKVSEPELTAFVIKGEIAKLSGYKADISDEKAWLNGNLPKTGVREKAGVYVINSEILENPDAWYDVEAILDLGVENIEKFPQKEPEKPKIEPETVSIGSDCYIRRKASEKEQCLDVCSYANVLSTFFNKAKGDGEFCFGLFGHWGRGKTYLMDMVEGELKADKYETIFFSAWKYRTTPEAWIHLYETFAERLAGKGNWFKRFPHLVRVGIAGHGLWGIILCILIFGFSILPLREKVSALLPLYKIIGIAGIFLCLRMYFGIRRISSTLKRYITLSRHGDKLGLQELIGKDLKSLIVGWVPLNEFKVFSLLGCLYLVLVGLVAYILFPEKPQMLTAWKDIVKYLPYIFSWGVFLVWLVVAVGGALYAVLGGRETKQILLVVDDLDRCKPEQMLEIMESLKLLLEETKIHERIQVVMLVDEEMLHHAIEEKFATFIESKNNKVSNKVSKEDISKEIINEHIEKLFASYLRLPELSFDEVSEVARKYLEQFGSVKDVTGTPSTLPAKDTTDDVPEKETKEPLEIDEQETIDQDEESEDKALIAPKTLRKISIKDTVFEEYERGRLALAIPAISQFDKSRKWGPRSIRALLLKYQLSRLLLMALGIEFTPKELIDGLNAASAVSPELSKGHEGKSKDVERVIDQVK